MNTVSNVETQTTDAQTTNVGINTLLCRIEGGQLLLPDTLIAEVIEYQQATIQMPSSPATQDETDDEASERPLWYLGTLQWRQLSVPLVSLEALNSGGFFIHNHQLKIIILNSIGEHAHMPYWGFISKDTPRMQRISADYLVADNTAELGNIEFMRAELLGEPVLLPDLEKIEALLIAAV